MQRTTPTHPHTRARARARTKQLGAYDYAVKAYLRAYGLAYKAEIRAEVKDIGGGIFVRIPETKGFTEAHQSFHRKVGAAFHTESFPGSQENTSGHIRNMKILTGFEINTHEGELWISIGASVAGRVRARTCERECEYECERAG